MGTREERRNNSNERIFGREGGVSYALRALLEKEAVESGLRLEFSELDDPGYFLRRIDAGGDLLPDGDFEIKAAMIVGSQDEEGVGYGGGYLVELYSDGASEPGCVVLGAANDYNERSGTGVAGQKPLYVFRMNRDRFAILCGRDDQNRRVARLQAMARIPEVEQKVEEVVRYIEGHFDRPRGVPIRVVPAPRLQRGWDPLRDPVDEPRSRPVPPPIKPAPRPPKVVSFSPGREALSRRTATVRSLSEELAEALRDSETAEITGLPEGFPFKIKLLLEAGSVELNRLGAQIATMTFLPVYEGKEETTYSVSSGERCEGQYLVYVNENKSTGKLVLMIGYVLNQGEGRSAHSVSLTLNYENSYPVVVPESVIELAVVCDGITVRADYEAKSGRLTGFAGGRRDSKAGKLLGEYFPEGADSFASALNTLRERTRKRFGWLGK